MEGEPTTKMVEGVSYSWCGICRRWTSGQKQHETAQHRRRQPATQPSLNTPQQQQPQQNPPSLTPAMNMGREESVTIAPAAHAVTGSSGHLHLQTSLFLGNMME
jgi:hypothetical protein